jgi:hypothetical protein
MGAGLEQPGEGGHMDRQHRGEPWAGQVGRAEVGGDLWPGDPRINTGQPVGEVLHGLVEGGSAAGGGVLQRRKLDGLGAGQWVGMLAAQFGPPFAGGAG